MGQDVIHEMQDDNRKLFKRWPIRFHARTHAPFRGVSIKNYASVMQVQGGNGLSCVDYTAIHDRHPMPLHKSPSRANLGEKKETPVWRALPNDTPRDPFGWMRQTALVSNMYKQICCWPKRTFGPCNKGINLVLIFLTATVKSFADPIICLPIYGFCWTRPEFLVRIRRNWSPGECVKI